MLFKRFDSLLILQYTAVLRTKICTLFPKQTVLLLVAFIEFLSKKINGIDAFLIAGNIFSPKEQKKACNVKGLYIKHK